MDERNAFKEVSDSDSNNGISQPRINNLDSNRKFEPKFRMTMAGPPGGRELKTVPIISIQPESNMGTSESNIKSRASSVLSKASAAHDKVKKKSKNVLGELMRVKKEIEMPDRTSRLRFEAGGSDSEAGDVPC